MGVSIAHVLSLTFSHLILKTKALSQMGKIAKKKQSEGVRVGTQNTVLKIQCYIVKNTLLQTAYSPILPTGMGSTKIVSR